MGSSAIYQPVQCPVPCPFRKQAFYIVCSHPENRSPKQGRSDVREQWSRNSNFRRTCRHTYIYTVHTQRLLLLLLDVSIYSRSLLGQSQCPEDRQDMKVQSYYKPHQKEGLGPATCPRSSPPKSPRNGPICPPTPLPPAPQCISLIVFHCCIYLSSYCKQRGEIV